uniref:MARVEL domain-containing protein n=1 Tax=Haemonchus contortus TaxID=6289 RepID=A0A7I5E977_HAECO
MTRSLNWFLTPIPILKLCQTVCCLLVIVFFIDGRIQWGTYTLIYTLSFVLAFGCMITLLLHYFEVPKESRGGPWTNMELLWNAIGCALCAIGCIVLVWDWWQMRSGRHHHHSTLAPRNIGESRWLRRVAIVAASLLLATCLFLFTFIRVRRVGIN